MDGEEYYYIFNLFNVGYVMSSGVSVEKIEERNGKVAFYFKDNEQLQEVVKKMKEDKFYKSYVDNYMAAKRMMYNKKNVE